MLIFSLQLLHCVQWSSLLQQYTSPLVGSKLTVGSVCVYRHTTTWQIMIITVSLPEAQSSADLSSCCVAQTSSADPSPITIHTHLHSSLSISGSTHQSYLSSSAVSYTKCVHFMDPVNSSIFIPGSQISLA